MQTQTLSQFIDYETRKKKYQQQSKVQRKYKILYIWAIEQWNVEYSPSKPYRYVKICMERRRWWWQQQEYTSALLFSLSLSLSVDWFDLIWNVSIVEINDETRMRSRILFSNKCEPSEITENSVVIMTSMVPRKQNVNL